MRPGRRSLEEGAHVEFHEFFDHARVRWIVDQLMILQRVLLEIEERDGIESVFPDHQFVSVGLE